MLDDLYNGPIENDPIETPPTQFERDIDNFVITLKEKVSQIHQQYNKNQVLGPWIDGKEILKFKERADEVVKKYSKHLTESEPKSIDDADKYLAKLTNNSSVTNNKNLAILFTKWIDEIQMVSKTENLSKVLETVESLKSRVSHFNY